MPLSEPNSMLPRDHPDWKPNGYDAMRAAMSRPSTGQTNDEKLRLLRARFVPPADLTQASCRAQWEAASDAVLVKLGQLGCARMFPHIPALEIRDRLDRAQ